jgi:hypothetical protein
MMVVSMVWIAVTRTMSEINNVVHADHDGCSGVMMVIMVVTVMMATTVMMVAMAS